MRKICTVAATLAVGTLAAAVAGLFASSPSRAAEPAPAGAPPAISAAGVRQIAMLRAASAGDSNPAVSVVGEEPQKALEAMQAPGGTSFQAASESSVYLVTMHGNFSFGAAHVPRGFNAPTGNVMKLIVARDGFVLGLHIANE